MEREIRNLETPLSELRAVPESRDVTGYGIVFNKRSKDLGGFIEIILPSAVEGVIPQSDVLALLNHDINRGILARSTRGKGSLKLETDPRGVKYSFTAPKTALGDEVIEGIKRGDIRTSSFAFNVSKGGESWERSSGYAVRTISKFAALYDVSMVYREAYPDTTVALRSLQEFEKKKSVTDNMTPHQKEIYHTHQMYKDGYTLRNGKWIKFK
ncbi:MAG: HK97 family phage prohead protease [Bacteroidales bacterium]|nr:HK97 family phage prohead protease [Bacteroidales bacterium]